MLGGLSAILWFSILDFCLLCLGLFALFWFGCGVFFFGGGVVVFVCFVLCVWFGLFVCFKTGNKRKEKDGFYSRSAFPNYLYQE